MVLLGSKLDRLRVVRSSPAGSSADDSCAPYHVSTVPSDGRNRPQRLSYGPLVNDQADNPSQLAALHARVVDLRQTIAELQERRDALSRKRRRNLLIVGVGLSLVLHLCLLIYLALVQRGLGGGGSPTTVAIEFATLHEQELIQPEKIEFDDLLGELAAALEDIPQEFPSADLTAEVSAANLEISPAGAMPALGGSGDGTGDQSLGGGGAGTSFFGVSSRGTRFAYIVDISGSMGSERKIQIAMRELSQSITDLPDFAYFYIVLFSSDATVPPMQENWNRARPSTVRHFIRWLGQVAPGGGTQPRSAFSQVFSLQDRPDVIFFMTDGEITNFSAQEVAAYNGRGRRVVINTIAFGDPSSQDLLRDIARESGGVYRFIPSGGR